MPKLVDALPEYRKQKASGQAVVTLCGRVHYLGPHGTKASKVLYDRLVAEWSNMTDEDFDFLTRHFDKLPPADDEAEEIEKAAEVIESVLPNAPPR